MNGNIDHPDTPAQTNGTTAPNAPLHTHGSLSEDAAYSPEYRAFKARLDAYEMWETMGMAERREIVLDHSPPPQWFEEPALPTLASFRNDPLEWGRIKAKGRECGVNVWDLEKAVDSFLQAKQKTQQTSTETDAPGQPPTSSADTPRFQTISSHNL